jgi:hypothetical protein
MAHATYLREKARRMRVERRMTIDEIAARLALPRTTIYYWVRELVVPRSAFDPRPASEAQKRAAQANKRRARLRREAAYREGVKSFDVLCAQDPEFRDFVCLYIAEGYRRNRNVVDIGNSDPAIMRMSHRWMLRLAENPLAYRIAYHADQDLAELKSFWGRELAINGDVIRLQRKSNSNQLTGRTWRCRYGVLHVTCGDTQFRARLEAWMDRVKAGWG